MGNVTWIDPPMVRRDRVTPWFELGVTDRVHDGTWRVPDPWCDYCRVGERVRVAWPDGSEGLAVVIGHTASGSAVVQPEEEQG